MRNILVNSIISLALLLISCSRTENGMVRKRVIENMKYEVAMVPKSYFNEENSIEMADLMYYRFTISEDKPLGKIAALYKPSTFNKVLYYIDNAIQHDFSVLYNGKEIEPIQIHFESNNSISKKLVFMLAFEKIPDMKNELLLRFKDNIFNNGTVNFNYTAQDFNGI